MARPSPPVRYLVLVASVVCLLCAVCARQQRPSESARPTQVNPEGNPSASPADAGPPERKQDFFPGTKAPAGLLDEKDWSRMVHYGTVKAVKQAKAKNAQAQAPQPAQAQGTQPR